MSIHNLTEERLQELEEKSLNGDLTDEEHLELHPEGSTEQDVLEVEVPDIQPEDPDKKVEKSAPTPPDKKESLPAGTPPPPPVTPSGKIPDEAYNAIIGKHPNLAKFPNDDNFASRMADSYVNLESEYGKIKSKSTELPPPPPITDEQKLADLNKTILAETERNMLSDPTILNALVVKDEEGNVTETIPFPRTQDDWDRLEAKHPYKRMALEQRGREIYNSIKKSVVEQEQQVAYAPEFNQKASDEFVADIGEYCKKLAPTATPEDLKEVGDKLKDFVSKAYADEKYYTKTGKAFFLNKKLLFGDFIATNPELISKMAEVNAKNTIHDTTKGAIKNAQRQTSIKTLANNNINSGSRKKINLLDPRERSRLSDEQLNTMIQESANS